MLRISKWLLICALIVSIGGHWAILQSIAWVNMTVTFSHESSLSEALTKTFDGKHPCKLCQAVREGKKCETTQEAKIDLKKLDFASDTALAFEFPKPVRQNFVTAAFRSVAAVKPPSPPPREFLS